MLAFGHGITIAMNAQSKRMTMMTMRMMKMLKMTMMLVAMAAAAAAVASEASAPHCQCEQARRAALVGAARRAMH